MKGKFPELTNGVMIILESEGTELLHRTVNPSFFHVLDNCKRAKMEAWLEVHRGSLVSLP